MVVGKKQLQRDILRSAGTRANGFVLPLPASAGLDRQAAAALIDEMIRREFIVERPVLPHEAFWMEDDAERSTVLVITGLGVRALAADPGRNILQRGEDGSICADDLPVEPGKSQPTQSHQALPPSLTKLQLIVDALRAEEGASIEELATLTSWQPKSVRAAISAQVRARLGYDVETLEDGGRARRYRLTSSGRLAVESDERSSSTSSR